jgi:hypothetical protein
MIDAPYDLSYASCPNDTDNLPLAVGVFDVWQLIDGELTRTLHLPLCEHRSFDQLFPNGEQALEFQAWERPANPDDPYSYAVVPTRFFWDVAQQKYVSSVSSTTPNVIPIVTPTPDPVEALRSFTGDNTAYVDDVVSRARGAEGVDQGLQILDDALADLAVVDDESLDTAWLEGLLRYQRALLLKEARRWDALLEEYVTLYELAPQTTWGRLARLHIARICYFPGCA